MSIRSICIFIEKIYFKSITNTRRPIIYPRGKLSLTTNVPKPLIFGTVFTNEKLVPKTVEFLNILQKVQVGELAILT